MVPSISKKGPEHLFVCLFVSGSFTFVATLCLFLKYVHLEDCVLAFYFLPPSATPVMDHFLGGLTEPQPAETINWERLASWTGVW